MEQLPSSFENKVTFLMKKGVFDTTSQEFAQFKRQNITKWGAISLLLNNLEKFIQKYNLNLVYISANKLVYYADMDLDRYTDDEYLDCVSNKPALLTT